MSDSIYSSMSNGIENWSHLNFETIFGDLYQIKLCGIYKVLQSEIIVWVQYSRDIIGGLRAIETQVYLSIS